MKNIFAFALALSLTSCMDIGSAMFFGGEGTYEFSNASLPDTSYYVDESKLHPFTVSSDQDTIHVLFIGDFAQIQNDTIIVYLHGNGRSMDVFWEAAAHFANVGGRHRYGVVMYDYRGFGKSTGATENAETMAADYDAVMAWLEGNGLTSDRMVVFANSLGSLPAGPAAAGGSRIAIEKLVMEVPQSTADVIMQNSTRLSLPSSMITAYNFDLGEDMKNYSGELLWMHGEADAVAPFETAAEAMRMHEGSYYTEAIYPEAGHGLRWDITPAEWERVLHEFMLH